MEIQDRTKKLDSAALRPDQVTHALKMQKVRFQRFADLFKIGLETGMPELDLYHVFFHNGISKLLSPLLRKNIILYCMGKVEKSALLNYLVILEANDNPYAVQERFERQTIDLAFDQSRSALLSLSSQELAADPIWARTALHLAHYFKAI